VPKVLSTDGFALSVISTTSTLDCPYRKSGSAELVELDAELDVLEELNVDDELDTLEVLDEEKLDDELEVGPGGAGGCPRSRHPG